MVAQFGSQFVIFLMAPFSLDLSLCRLSCLSTSHLLPNEICRFEPNKIFACCGPPPPQRHPIGGHIVRRQTEGNQTSKPQRIIPLRRRPACPDCAVLNGLKKIHPFFHGALNGLEKLQRVVRSFANAAKLCISLLDLLIRGLDLLGRILLIKRLGLLGRIRAGILCLGSSVAGVRRLSGLPPWQTPLHFYAEAILELIGTRLLSRPSTIAARRSSHRSKVRRTSLG